MIAVVNLAAERARRSIDSLLDRIEGIRRELDQAPMAKPADSLRDVVACLAEVGITMLAATVVMHEDLDRRFRDLQRQRRSARGTPLSSGCVER
jgi:hypothetical protein